MGRCEKKTTSQERGNRFVSICRLYVVSNTMVIALSVPYCSHGAKSTSTVSVNEYIIHFIRDESKSPLSKDVEYPQALI